ncbi:hypothetical protein [Mycobacterium asiaticum]|uniref:DUF2530 domain-containing protein n=1 Tax=Mycobacterium asiaticum TaxID=1790 RepID=A0A1A3NVU4_MYCAS|nr:hypothetical protein [Mycobacterium asiaticum]OBK26071.1 hypothetical protein A5635_14580 [Mycobacterium asiaticum]OBK96928.1 hypothetical protein A5645_07400 [Mycobacterium asiaticum]
MVYIGTDVVAAGSAVADVEDERTVSVPGVLSAAVWTVGLTIGLMAMATGHDLLAGVALVLAIASPWFGLAWVSHNQRNAFRRQRSAAPATAVAPYAGGWPGRY